MNLFPQFRTRSFKTLLATLSVGAALSLTTAPCFGDSQWPLPIRAYYIPSGAMENTLRVNDRILVDTRVYESRAPRNGEIAVFKAPVAALAAQSARQDVTFVKRVVGVPGDVVAVVKRQLFRGGVAVREPYANWAERGGLLEGEMPYYAYDMKIVGGAVYSREYLGPNEPGNWTKNGIRVTEADQKRISAAKPEAIPANQFLMLGDHRSNSNDSHVWGFAPRGAFHGCALLVYWPVSRWKVLRESAK